MMGHSHALSGGLLWLVVAPTVAAVTGVHLGEADLAAGTLACAGAALVPDLDYPQSTISTTLGAATELVAGVVNVIAGGHRQATHSLLFAGFMGVVTWFVVAAGGVAPAVLFAVLVALALRALRAAPPGWGSPTVLIAAEAVAVTALCSRFGSGWAWLVPAMVIGAMSHNVSDILSPEGVPLLWPYPRRFSVPVIGHTGDVFESVLSIAMAAGVLLMSWRYFLAPSLHHHHHL